jgi:hypothetical protein
LVLDAHGHRLNNLAMSEIAAHEDEPAADEDELAGFLDRTTIQLMYKPVALIASVIGGLLASRAFSQIWRALAGKGDVGGRNPSDNYLPCVVAGGPCGAEWDQTVTAACEWAAQPNPGRATSGAPRRHNPAAHRMGIFGNPPQIGHPGATA